MVAALLKVLAEGAAGGVAAGGAGGAAARGAARVEKSGGKSVTGLLDELLKVFKPVADMIAAIVGILTFFVFKGVKVILETLGRLVEIFKDVWNSLVNGFNSLISWVKSVVDGVKSLAANIWSFFEEKFTDLVLFAKELPEKLKQFFKDLPGNIGTWIVQLSKDIGGWLIELPGKIWDKIKQLAGDIAAEIRAILPTFLGGDEGRSLAARQNQRFASENPVGSSLNPLGVSAGFAELLKKAVSSPSRLTDPLFTNVNDAIITKRGDVIKTNPNDTIIATQNPGGVGGGLVINFYGMTMPEAIQMVKREFGKSGFTQGRF